MKRIVLPSLAGILVLVMGCSNLWAQATAQISGAARDQSGAVLPGVEIKATQTETGITRESITNETGSYALPNLPIGPYRLEAALPGFRTYAQTGIVLQVNSSPVINVVLEVGQVSEQVEVQANAALVETRNAGVGQVIENARILELPLNGRSVVELVSLAGAAAPTPALDGAGGRDPFTRGNVSVAGGLSTGLYYSLDGAAHFNPYTNGYMSMPFPDALQEFKVETGATGAQNGMKSAGSVSLVTKSGTNDFHGDLFEFVRNGKFNARNAFSPTRDTIKRNQFGGTLGGPVAANKVFFFGGYQGTLVRQDPADIIAFVPTSALLAGDFTAFAAAACNAARPITLKAPFVNNRVDPAQFSKAALLLSSKLPKTTDPCGRTIYGMPKLDDDHQFIGRIDYQQSSAHSIFGRYLLDNESIPPPFDITHNLVSSTGIGTGNEGRAQAFTIGDTYLFGANVVNALRLTANRIYGAKTSPDFDSAGAGPTDLGIKAFSFQPHLPSHSVTGGFSTGYNGAGTTRSAVFALGDDVSIVRGNHQFAFGGQVSYWQLNSYSDSQAGLNFSFNGQTTGLGMADFLLGYVSQFQNGTYSVQNKTSRFAGLYASDVWKVNKKLTLNYGLRWEPYFPIHNNEGGAMNYDEEGLKKGIRSVRFSNTPAGLYFTGDPGFPANTGMYNKWSHFSPRVGLAWDVSGDGRTSVRASGATFYDFPAMLYMAGLTTGQPLTPRIIRTDVSFDNPWTGYPGGDPFPLPFGRAVPKDTPWPAYSPINDLDYDTPNTQVYQWNLSIQKQAGADWLVSASYLGNGVRHIWSLQQINPSVFLGLGPCAINGVSYTICSTTANRDQRRRLALAYPNSGGAGYGFIGRTDSGGTSSYNGLVLSVQRRAARGVTVSGNYTWSHCIGTPWDQNNNSSLSGTGWQDPNNRRLERGNCVTAAQRDRRHLFNLSAVAEIPNFSNRTLKIIGSGWRFSPIFRILSGEYMTITTNQDRALTAITGQRVNQILGNPYGTKAFDNYLNSRAFELPAMGTLGNVGIGSIAGPGTWQFDTAVSRTFQVTERQKLEIRAEAFNVTNSTRLDNPTTNLNSNTFGQITSAKDPRILQFALKYVF
jgi:carboxypeptidase family protein